MHKLSNMFLLQPNRKVHMSEMSVNLPTIFCIFSCTKNGTFIALVDRVYCFLFLSAGSDQLLMVELKKISRTIPFFNNESFLKFLQFVASFMLTSLQSFTQQSSNFPPNLNLLGLQWGNRPAGGEPNVSGFCLIATDIHLSVFPIISKFVHVELTPKI